MFLRRAKVLFVTQAAQTAPGAFPTVAGLLQDTFERVAADDLFQLLLDLLTSCFQTAGRLIDNLAGFFFDSSSASMAGRPLRGSSAKPRSSYCSQQSSQRLTRSRSCS